MPHTITYKGSLLNDEDISEIALEFKLSYALAAEAVDQLRQNGEILFAKYAGTARQRLHAFADAVAVDAPAAGADDPEPVAAAEPAAVEEPATTEPAPLTEEDEVVTHAANSLMQAFSDPSGCFLIQDDGCCSINEESPPTLDQAHEVVINTLKLKELGTVIDDKSSWMLGSLVDSLETLFGENVFCISQICEQTEQNHNTVYQKVEVFKAFKKKRYKCSYSSHQEVHFAKIPETALRPDPMDTKRLILSKAESHKLGPKMVRDLCSVAKTMEDDTVIKNIRSPQMAKDLIDAYRQNKVDYYVYNDGEMVLLAGNASEVPEGKLVIDTKNKTLRINGGEPIDIKKVTRPSHDAQ